MGLVAGNLVRRKIGRQRAETSVQTAIVRSPGPTSTLRGRLYPGFMSGSFWLVEAVLGASGRLRQVATARPVLFIGKSRATPGCPDRAAEFMRTSIHLEGDRVRVQRGPFPMDSSLVGRTGIVVRRSESIPVRYGVQLEGEAHSRDFAEAELAPAESASATSA